MRRHQLLEHGAGSPAVLRPHRLGDRLGANPAASRREVTRDFSERWESDNAAIGTDSGAVHPGATDDSHAPATVGAGSKHSEGIVSHKIFSSPTAAGDVPAD